MTTIITKKIQIKRLIYLCAVIIFIIIIFNANKIISELSGMSVNEIEFAGIPSKNVVYYDARKFEEYGNLTETVYFQAWAFCETIQKNNQKKVSLIFKSDTNCYESKCEIENRVDVYDTFKNVKNIRGKNSGFFSEFSTVSMKSGIYELYIYCWENEENYGLVNTEKLYKKNASGSFSEYIWTSSKVNKDFTDIAQGGLDSNIDIMEPMEDTLLSISGWAFVNKLNCREQKVYLKITDSNENAIIFNTRSTDRRDVGDANKSPDYNHSGFEACIPSDELKKGEIRIQIYIENNGVVYGDIKEYTYTIN